MEAAAAINWQSYSRIGSEKVGKRPNSALRFSQKSTVERDSNRRRVKDLRLRRGAGLIGSRDGVLEVSCCYKASAAPAKESGSRYASLDEALVLKKKSQDLITLLDGQSIYLVGMMGSGKTTVGKILSKALCYSFFDSDKLVEEAVGGTSVAQIFKDYSESFFRDNESRVLQKLSSMQKLVVATGGGAVIRPINWRHMKQGISVWLDVPLEALARRIAAVGTDSRPLLHHDAGDPYMKALMHLTRLYEERSEAYATADARVCLQRIAARQGNEEEDVTALSPTAIAIEALQLVDDFLRGKSPGKNIIVSEGSAGC